MSNIKILSAILSFLLLFAISCSNEGTTGGIVITKTEIEDMIEAMISVYVSYTEPQSKNASFNFFSSTFSDHNPNKLPDIASYGNNYYNFIKENDDHCC